jgi:hypothetical protein
MNKDPSEEGRISEDSRGLGTVTPEMVLERARELAVINGRPPDQILDSDLEQALRELTGEQEESPDQATLESLPESERWDPIPGSAGQQAPTVPAPDAQAELVKIVREGVDDAEHDQMLKGSREAARRDQII